MLGVNWYVEIIIWYIEFDYVDENDDVYGYYDVGVWCEFGCEWCVCDVCG